MAYFSVAWHQSRVLLTKNLRLARHNYKGTVAFVLIPSLIMFVLWVLSKSVTQNSLLAESIPHPPAQQLGPIPRCTIGPGLKSCYSLIYNYAGHPAVESLMATVRALNPQIPDAEVFSMSGNSTDVNNFLFSQYNTSQAAYVFVFDNATYPTTLPTTGPLFVLQTNSSSYPDCSGLQFYSCPSTGLTIAMPMLTSMATALLRYHGGATANANATATVMPFAHPVVFNVSVLPSSAAVWWMFASLFPLLLMLMQMVGEKEAKLKYAMSLIGVKWSSYWLSWAALYFVQLTVANLLALAVMAALGYDIVLQNSMGIILILLLLFQCSLVSTAFFMSTLFNDVKNARMCALFYLFIFGLFSQLGSLIYSDQSSVPSYWASLLSFLPPMVFSKSLLDLQTATSGQTAQIGIPWSQRSNFTTRFPFTTVFAWLAFDTVLYALLAFYLDGALPDVMGVRRKPWYPFTASYWGLNKAPPTGAGAGIIAPLESTPDLDPDVLAEYNEVRSGAYVDPPALVVRGLRKVFKPLFSGKGFVAVDNVSFAIPRNTMLCLLGPNGAGKSTTIAMITGAVEPTAGDAVLHGLSTLGSMDAIRESLGVCPQFDVLWDDLTGDENLAVFAGLKGLDGGALVAEVAARLEEVDLTEAGQRAASGYSGGMRRRLSVAMALTCSPSIVLLDEPTTGMDPVSRRKVWDIIERAKGREDRAMILTTHSMEEAEVLSDKIAIICNGRIRCIGTSLHLKEKFGSGYRVQVVASPEDIRGVWAEFTGRFPTLSVVEATMLHFTVQVAPDQISILPTVFAYLNERSAVVRDFHVSLTTLEDVFLRVADEAKGEEFEADQADAAATAIAAGATGPTSVLDGLGVDTGSVNRAGAARAPAAPPAPSSTLLQAKSLMAKTWHLQKRRRGTNCCQICCPTFIVIVMLLLQLFVFSSLNKTIKEVQQPVILSLNASFEPQGVSNGNPAAAFGFVNDSAAADALFTAVLPSLPVFNYFTGSFYESLTFPSLGALQSFSFLNWFKGVPTFNGALQLASFDAVSQSFGINILYNQTHSSTFDYLPSMYGLAVEAQMQTAFGSDIQIALSDMPVQEHTNKFDIISFLAAVLFPLVLFFQFPLFVGGIMYDKEKKLIEIMKMMGLRMSVYWAVSFAFDMMLYSLSVALLLVVGLAAHFQIFFVNSFGAYFVLFFLWGIAMTSMAFLFTTIFAKEFIATVVSYLLVIMSFISGLLLLGAVADSPSKLFLFSLYPYYAFTRGVFALATAALSGNGLSLASPGPDLGAVYGFLVVQTGVMLFLTWYLEQVFPAGYGVKKSPLFCLSPSYWRGECTKATPSKGDEEVALLPVAGSGRRSEHEEDPDVAAARRDVYDSPSAQRDGVRILGLRKAYGEKLALHNLAFGIRRGEVFGLLGHNGAGKTTAISILSGLTQPTAGDALIEGLSIRSNMDALHRIMGVCPQHDLLWQTMTAEEHLYFYGRLKGLDGAALKAAVEDVLRKLHLSYVRTRLAGRYSGGMKRRLSIGLALIGSPRIIFLDEPTTGLDPKNRRSIWAIIAGVCRDSEATVILTTHSMEEAEALSSRIGIMASGHLKVIGTSNHLKTKFAAGYKLSLQMVPEHAGSIGAVIAFVQTIVPSAVHLPQSLGASHHFHLPAEEVNLAVVFARMDAEKTRLHIAEWTVLQKTLEDVLLKITEAAEGGLGAAEVEAAEAKAARDAAAAAAARRISNSVGAAGPATAGPATASPVASARTGAGVSGDDLEDETERD